MKQALIFDLDNTIYPVNSISDYLFARFFELLEADAEGIDFKVLEDAKDAITRMPFHAVADQFNFSIELKNKGIQLLKDITYDLPMQPFEDYHQIKSLRTKKILVTTGFTNLQQSKIKMLGIEDDFAEIHVVDPEISKQTKRDVFADIMKRHNYKREDLLVIGDDPQSEIKAARELGIDTFLFDPEGKHVSALCTYRSRDLKEVITFLSV